MSQKELFDIQTECKQMTYAKLFWNRTVWPFYCVKTNDWRLIELLVIHNNTWNHLTLLTYAKENSLKLNRLIISL